MAEANSNEWQTPIFRQRIVNRIDEVMRNSQTQITKSSIEMEEYVFQKAHSREEYLDLAARVLLSVSEHNKEKKGGPGPMGPGGMSGQSSSGQPNMAGISGQSAQDPINALTNLAGASGAGMGMMNNTHNRPPNLMDPSQHIRGQQQQMMSHPRSQVAQKPPSLARQDAFMVTSPQAMPGTSSTNMSYPNNQSQVRPMGQSGMMMTSHIQQNPTQMQNPSQTSPMNIMSPHSTPSIMSPPMRVGVPSPSNMLHTPGQPVTNPSPGPPSNSQQEMEYKNKVEKMSMYIEPIRKSILDTEKKNDEESKKYLKKMKSLLDILTNPKKRVSMDVLDRCAVLLQQVHPHPSTNPVDGHMCQPLLDAVSKFSLATSLNHSLYRTFGPALEAYMGPPIRPVSPPPNRKRKLEKENSEELPDVLQGEIARLGRRFVVSVDPRHHGGSESHHLVCKLEDLHLPSVPPLMVSMPKTYPRTSPQCDPTACPGYDATEFFRNVEKNLTVHLAHMPNRFSLTQLLSSWEMSVRKACDPDSPIITQPSPIFVI